MERSRPQDAQQIKGSTLRHRERSDESVDKRPSDVPASQDEKKPFRRVRSPSRPRAWLSSSYQHKFGGRFHQPRFSRDDPGFGKHKYQHFTARDHFHRRDHPHKPYRIDLSTLRERERPGEKQRYESKEGPDGSSPPKQRCTPRAFAARSTSSSDKDTQLTICQSDRKQSRERDHRGAKSKERERSRDGELPPTASQTVARERAIQQKRREIDETRSSSIQIWEPFISRGGRAHLITGAAAGLQPLCVVPATVDLPILVEVDEVHQQLLAHAADEAVRVPARPMTGPGSEDHDVPSVDLTPALERREEDRMFIRGQEKETGETRGVEPFHKR